MTTVKPGYQEYRGNDIYTYVEMAEITATRGAVKWIRFWLFDSLLLQGWVDIPRNSRHGDVVKVTAKQIMKQFSYQESRGELPSTLEPTGDLFVVVCIKKKR